MFVRAYYIIQNRLQTQLITSTLIFTCRQITDWFIMHPVRIRHTWSSQVRKMQLTQLPTQNEIICTCKLSKFYSVLTHRQCCCPPVGSTSQPLFSCSWGSQFLIWPSRPQQQNGIPLIVGSSPITSSPTSASAMACRIAGPGLVTVSLRRSTTREWAAPPGPVHRGVPEL